MPDALTSTFTAVNRQTRGDLPQLDGTNTTRFRPTYLRHAGPTSVKLPQIGWERTFRSVGRRGAVSDAVEEGSKGLPVLGGLVRDVGPDLGWLGRSCPLWSFAGSG